MFGRNWEPASGVVIDKRMGRTKGSGDSAFATMDFIIDVRTSAGDFFRAEVDQPRWSDFWPPKVGQTVKVEVDAKSRKVRFVKDDNTLSFAAYQRQQSDSFDAQLAAPAGTPAAAAPSPIAGNPALQALLAGHAGAAFPGSAATGSPMPGIAPEQLQAMIAAAMANGSAVRMNLPPEAAEALRTMGRPADGSAPTAQ